MTKREQLDVDIEGQTEDALQQKCVFWFNNNFENLRGLLFSVPNGGLRDSKTAMTLKMTGQINGVSDLIFLYKKNTYLIELKTRKGTQSKSQFEWEKKVKNNGFIYVVIRSLRDFKNFIHDIIIANG